MEELVRAAGPGGPPGSSRRGLPAHPALAPLVLVVAIVLAYSNSFRGAFLFVDIDSIVSNASLQSLSSALTPPLATSVCGRPLLNLSLAVNRALGATNVVGYHFVNLAIHVLAALLLFDLLRRTLRGPDAAPGVRDGATGVSLAIALLWGLHPLHTSAVTYIVQRAESMMGLFYLLTLYALVRGAASERPRGWYAAGVASCALGMATKEAMVTAPVLALVYDRIFLSRSWREIGARRGVFYALLAATWVILGYVMSTCPGRSGTVGGGAGIPPLTYGLTQLGVIVHYLRLTFWPHPLVLDYGWPLAHSLSEILLPAVVVAGLLAATIVGLIRKPRAGFLGSALFLLLAPTSSVIPVQDPIFEHRMYLPLASVIAAVVLALRAGLAGAGRGPRLLGVLAVGLAAVALGGATFARNRDYRSEVSIWRDTIEKRPQNARAHDLLGIALARTQDLEAAIASHTEAIRLQPKWSLPYYNRGISRLFSGLYDEAIVDFTDALRRDRDPDAFNNRAVCYLAIGAYDNAWADIDSMRALGATPNPAFLERLRAASGRTGP
jgi:hypothetical protein